jgi:hypothetical protein
MPKQIFKVTYPDQSVEYFEETFNNMLAEYDRILSLSTEDISKFSIEEVRQ